MIVLRIKSSLLSIQTRYQCDGIVMRHSLTANGTYPSFSQFVEFVTKETCIACNPVSSLHALNDAEHKTRRDFNSNKVKGFATIASNQPTKVSLSDGRFRICDFCKSEGHLISKCSRFTSLSIDRKLLFMREANLCFGSLRKGHYNKETHLWCL